jgi:hypothetical protein
MKTAFAVILIILLTSFAEDLYAQNVSSMPLADFRILVETKGDEVKLTCTEGCAFKQLIYSTNPYRSQVIGYYGMSKAASPDSIQRSEPFEFLFSLQRSEYGIELKGMYGSAWTKLTFSCPVECSQFIDEYGMAGEE